MGQGTARPSGVLRGSGGGEKGPALDSYPSSLKKGDLVTYKRNGVREVKRGEVTDVFPNGAFIGEVDEHGLRLLRKADWCPDTLVFIEEVNGESVF